MKIIIPEKLSKNHNVSSESDFHHAVRYIWFFLFLLLGLYLFFYTTSLIVVRYVSIENEIRYFWSKYMLSNDKLPDDLAERYKDISYDIYLMKWESEENAFAWLGWNIYLTEGLLQNTQHYESLDFIVGHEIAHIENRDVLRGLIINFPIQIVLSFFDTDSWVALFNSAVSHWYSRSAENRSDLAWIEFTQKLNWHVWCSLEFFHGEHTFFERILEPFSTHPASEKRIKTLNTYIDKNWYTVGECTPYSYEI